MSHTDVVHIFSAVAAILLLIVTILALRGWYKADRVAQNTVVYNDQLYIMIQDKVIPLTQQANALFEQATATINAAIAVMAQNNADRSIDNAVKSAETNRATRKRLTNPED